MRTTKRLLLYVMGPLYVVAGLNHLLNPDLYVAIMPPYIPWHLGLVWVSGVIEIALGIGVLVPRTRRLAGWGTIALLLAVFPANLHMALADAGTYDAPAWGLWLRLPIQGLLIAWAWWATRPEEDA